MAGEGNSTSWQEQMAGIVECPICAETFSNNRLLPCGHTFCLKCLEEHRKVSKPRGKSLICPVCRKEFIIPKGGLPALPKNYSVQQLIDADHQQREDKDMTRCDICDSDKQTTSVSYCLQCDQNLCVDCEKLHRKMKGCSHHHAVPVSKKEQLKEFADDSQCAEHPDFRVDLVCIDCNSLICWKCKCLEHQLHNSDEIDDMADRCKEQLRSNIKESENRMSLLCKLSVNLKDKETQQHEILEKEKNSIAKISAELIRAIVVKEDALLKQVTTVAQKNIKRLQPHRERLEKQVDELKQHTTDMKQLCDYGKPLELFRRSNELYAKTAKFLSLEITSTEASLSCLPESEIRKQLLADKVEVQRQFSSRALIPNSGRNLDRNENSSSSEATALQLAVSTDEIASDAIPTSLPQNQEVLPSPESRSNASVNVYPANYSRCQLPSSPLSLTSMADRKKTTVRRRSSISTRKLANYESESTTGQLSGQAPTARRGRNFSCPEDAASQLQMLLSGRARTARSSRNSSPPEDASPQLEMLLSGRARTARSGRNSSPPEDATSQLQMLLSGRAPTPYSGRNSSSPEATASQLEMSTYEVPSDAIPTVLPQSKEDILTSMEMSSPYQFLEIGRIRAKEVGKAVCGVTVLRQEVYIIQDRCPQIQVYDLTNFSFRSKINIEGLVQPNDLASCESYNCIYVVDWRERTIHRVEVVGDDKIVTKWHTGKEFGGISRSYDSNVILAGFLTGILREYSTKGNLIREILLKPDIQEDIHPWLALKLPSGEFVVSHGNGTFGQHRVCLVDVGGNVINSFGGSKGSGTDKLFGPYHMALARNGDVFVADCNNRRVVRLNGKLKYQEEITMNVRRPRRLCFEPTSSKLLVASNDITDGNKASDGAIIILKAKSIYV